MGGSELQEKSTHGVEGSSCSAFCCLDSDVSKSGTELASCCINEHGNHNNPAGCEVDDDLAFEVLEIEFMQKLDLNDSDELAISSQASEMNDTCDGSSVMLDSLSSDDSADIEGLQQAVKRTHSSGGVQSEKTTTASPVSALKGSRAQRGIAVESKLTVKWAPDVYDPPVTSVSHAVKGHRSRPKASKKDYHKQKQSKGGSSHSRHDKKHSTRGRGGSKIVDQPLTRQLHANHGNASQLQLQLENVPEPPPVVAKEHSVDSKDMSLRWGGYCRGPLAAVPYALTEAL